MDWPLRLRRRLWDLQRFGLTPRGLYARLRPPAAPRVLCISLPKAGTHLLERALCIDPRLYRPLIPTVHDRNLASFGGFERLLDRLRDGQILVSHLAHTPARAEAIRRRGIKAIFLIRDPRDIVVSQAHYIVSQPRHPFHRHFAARGALAGRLRLAIAGDADAGIPSIGERLAEYAGWLDAELLVLRFEELIGPVGGGATESQLAAFARLYRHLDLPDDPNRLGALARRVVSDASPTFRKGRIGGWQGAFDAYDLSALFERVAAPAMRLYDYHSAAEGAD